MNDRLPFDLKRSGKGQRLRRAADGWTPSARQRAVTRAIEDLRPLQVLLAEDDPDMRALIASALRRDGYDVDEARDAADLARKLANQILAEGGGLDLLVSDVRMPGGSGLDIAAGLRRSRWQLPIILITAFGSQELRQEAQAAGIGIVVDKPFTLDTLRFAVRRAVGGAA